MVFLLSRESFATIVDGFGFDAKLKYLRQWISGREISNLTLKICDG
jgi:hypothetical protein